MKRIVQFGLAMLLVGVGPSAQAVFSAFSVLDTKTSFYDVDRGTQFSIQYETRAVSQWVQETWLGLGFPKYAALQWVDTALIDFWRVEYTWGPPPAAPNIQGVFNAAAFFGVTLGSQSSAVVWSTVTTKNAYAIRSAPAVFDVQNCGLVSCSTFYTVNLNSAGQTTAQYHVPTSAGTGAGVQGAQSASAAASPAVFDLAVGEVLSLTSGLDVVDTAANSLTQRLFAFTSAVEKLGDGQYRYTYELVNDTGVPVDALWDGLAIGPQSLGTEPGVDDTFTLSFLSNLGPVEAAGRGTLVLRNEYPPDDTFGGSLQYLRPVPLPGAALLFLGALVGVAGFRRNRVAGGGSLNSPHRAKN